MFFVHFVAIREFHHEGLEAHEDRKEVKTLASWRLGVRVLKLENRKLKLVFLIRVNSRPFTVDSSLFAVFNVFDTETDSDTDPDGEEKPET